MDSFSLPIFMFHQVHPRTDLGYDPYLSVTPEGLDQYVLSLKQLGYQIKTLSQAMHARLAGDKTTKYAVLTFDDLYAPFAQYAWPILQSHGVSATGFVIGSTLLSDGSIMHLEDSHLPRLPISRLIRMAEEGLEVGSHTMTHRTLGSLTPADSLDEMCRSKTLLESLCDQPVQSLAYPCGDFHQETLALAQQAGYRWACTTERGNTHAIQSLFRLARIRAREGMGVFKLRYSMHRLYDPILRRHNLSINQLQ